jgi:hypothetical protein
MRRGNILRFGGNFFFSTPCPSPCFRYTYHRGNKKAVKVKPVQAKEKKDKKMAIEVIKKKKKPIPASVYRRLKKKDEYIDKLFPK